MKQTVSAETATVLIVDDDQAVRDSLRDLFESVGLRVEAFASAHEVLQAKRPSTPCCLVLDVRLPGPSGLDFQRELSEKNIVLPIVFLTGHGDIPMSVRAIKAGAVEFLTKPFREQDLLDAVAAAIERDRANRDQEGRLVALRARFDLLTPRERAVMGLVVAGRRNKQIAHEIAASETTVKAHRTNLMRKMQASSLADLIAMAGKLGLPQESVVAVK
jgi:FixJ family two-component response regulator